jgi:outer membrane cobalamin receptor
MKKLNIIAVLLVLAAGLILAFSSDYNSAGAQYGTQASQGNSLAQQNGASAPSGISSKGNAPGVYDWKNKVVPTPAAQQAQTAQTATNAGEIVVTARRVPEDIALVPRNVEVIKAAAIADSGEAKLQDVLDSIPGAIVLRSGGYQGVSSVLIRGANSSHTLIMQDGVPLNDIEVGGVDLNQIEIGDIDRIEIVKGGLSSVYGANAASGVINVITGSKEEKPVVASASYGSYNFQKYAVSSDYKVFGVKYSASAVEEKSDGYTDNSAYLKNTLNAKLAFTGDFLDSTLFGYYFNRQMGVPFSGLNPPYDKSQDAKETDENYHFGADEKFNIGVIKAQLSGYMRSAQLRFIEPSIFMNSNQKKKEYNGSFNMLYDEGGFFSGMTGYEANLKQLDSTDIGNTTNTNQASVSNISVKMLDDKLLINMGFRADFNSAYNNMSSENISAKYKFPENVDFRVSFDKSFSAPTLGDLYWPVQDFGYGYYMKGNPGLKPEDSTSYEIGVGKKDAKITESVTFFKSEIVNLISWMDMTDGTSVTTTPFNINKAEISGIEAKVDFVPADFLAVYVRYTFLRAVDQNNKQLPYRPEGAVDAGVNIKFPFDTKLTVDGQYVDLRKDNSGKTLKSYYLLNCTAVHEISKNVKVFLDFKNILDNTTYEVVSNFPMPGRTFNAEIQLRF